MPANLIKSFADKTGREESEIENLWDKAKEIAKKEGQEDNYAFITGLLKKMLNESLTFKEYNLLENVYSEWSELT